MIRVGFLHSLLRLDEKLLLEEFARRKNVEMVMIDDRELAFTLGRPAVGADIVLERCINHSRALHALQLFEKPGHPLCQLLAGGGRLRRQADDVDRPPEARGAAAGGARGLHPGCSAGRD